MGDARSGALELKGFGFEVQGRGLGFGGHARGAWLQGFGV